jgi:hypothetical protein
VSANDSQGSTKGCRAIDEKIMPSKRKVVLVLNYSSNTPWGCMGRMNV